jgi:hypothetical protein
MSTSSQPAPDPSLQAQRFRAFDGLQVDMGQSRQLVYCPLTGEAKVLGKAMARVVQTCQSAATLDAHTEALRRLAGLTQAQAQAVRAQLGELAASGLLVSEAMLIERCRAGSDTNVAPPPISSLGIPTHERPASLRRSLGGFAENSRRLGRAMRFVVADGSDDPQARRDNERTLAEVKEEYGCEIAYIGPEEKAAFAGLLARHAHVAPDIVRFAVLNDERCPVSTGGNRNALLFATVGELTLQVDDDAECVLAPGPAMRHGITLSSGYDPTQLWFAGDELAAAQAGGPAAADFFALHERLLGQSLAACLQGLRDADVNTDGMAMSFLRRLRGDSNKVHVTSVGFAGDLGTGSAFSLLRLDADAHRRLVRSADDYRRSMHSQQVVRAVGNATISDGTFCMGLNLGLDNREPLPPFMPVQRNQDGIFAKAVRATGAGYFGHLPWTILHRRPQRWEHEPRAGASVSSGSIIEELVSSFRYTESAGAERNLANLGSLLVELGTQPPRDFREVLQRVAWMRAVQRINRLEQLLARHNHKPDFWAHDVVGYLSTLRDALTQEHYAVPSDLRAAFEPDAAAILMQRLVRKFGELLEAWPQLRRTALELRLQGREIGRRI